MSRDFQYHAVEPKPYRQRIQNSLLLNAAISVAVFLTVTALSNFSAGLTVAVFFAAVQYIKMTNWERNYIKYISISSGRIAVEYLDKETIKHIEAAIEDVKMRKKLTVNTARTAYLLIEVGNQQIKQFEFFKEKEWNEDKMDALLRAFYFQANI
jgi:hypothetical protein